VRDVRDELRLEPLGAQLLVHGLLHAVRDAVEIFTVGFEVPIEMAEINLVVQIAPGQRLAALLQLPQGDERQNDRGGQHDAPEKPPRGKAPRVAAAGRHENELHKAQPAPDKRALPAQGQIAEHIADAAPEPAEEPAEQHEDFVYDGVLPPAARLDPRGEGHEHRHAEQDAQDARERQSYRGVDGVRAAGEVAEVGESVKPGGTEQKQEKQIEIQRNPVEPAEVHAFHALLVSGGAEQEDEQEQAHGEARGRDGDEGPAPAEEPFGQIVERVILVLDGERAAQIPGQHHVRVCELIHRNSGGDAAVFVLAQHLAHGGAVLGILGVYISIKFLGGRKCELGGRFPGFDRQINVLRGGIQMRVGLVWTLEEQLARLVVFDLEIEIGVVLGKERLESGKVCLGGIGLRPQRRLREISGRHHVVFVVPVEQRIAQRVYFAGICVVLQKKENPEAGRGEGRREHAQQHERGDPGPQFGNQFFHRLLASIL